MRSFFRVFSIILLVAWMGVIFYFSSQPAVDSSKTSGEVIEIIAEKFYPEFENLSKTEREEVVSSFQFVARKSAHAAIFSVLGIFAFLTFISYVKLRFLTRISLATLISLLYAAGDEFHQRFVEGRSCELRDFLLDAGGVVAAILICTLFVKIIGPLRRKTKFSGKSRKQLKELNNELFSKLDDVSHQKRQLESEIKSQAETIGNLQKAISTQNARIMALKAEKETANNEVLEMEQKATVEFSDEMKYAASAIGSVVVEVTKVCNKLTDSADQENKKELINLALGKSEVFKAQVLRILESEVDFANKQKMIEQERQETFDYFDSIIAQMC